MWILLLLGLVQKQWPCPFLLQMKVPGDKIQRKIWLLDRNWVMQKLWCVLHSPLVMHPLSRSFSPGNRTQSAHIIRYWWVEVLNLQHFHPQFFYCFKQCWEGDEETKPNAYTAQPNKCKQMAGYNYSLFILLFPFYFKFRVENVWITPLTGQITKESSTVFKGWEVSPDKGEVQIKGHKYIPLIRAKMISCIF